MRLLNFLKRGGHDGLLCLDGGLGAAFYGQLSFQGDLSVQLFDVS